MLRGCASPRRDWLPDAAPVSVTVARRYKRWGLRCCTIEEFARWVCVADAVQSLVSESPSKTVFCADGSAPVCEQLREVGLCVRAARIA